MLHSQREQVRTISFLESKPRIRWYQNSAIYSHALWAITGLLIGLIASVIYHAK